MPPPSVVLPSPLPTIPDRAADPAPAKKPKPPKITLQKLEESGPQGEHGASQVLGRRATVKVSGSTLTAKLTGVAAAYNAVACPGRAMASIRMVQPFDIETAPGANPWVSVTLTAEAEGYVRTMAPATGGLRLASAAVYPAAGGPPIALGLSPAGVADGRHFHYQQSLSVPPTVVPAGRYVLVMDFAVEAAVSSLFYGYSAAVFASAIPRDPPVGANPYADLDPEALGFTVVLKATSL